MKINMQSDFPISDEAAKAATGRTLQEWIALVEAKGPGAGRREVISWLYEEMGRGKDMWWPTTVWVEYERSKGILNKKDGLLEGYNICVTKTIAASVEAVYQAWTTHAVTEWLGCQPPVEGAPYKGDDATTGTWTRLRENKDVRLEWQTHGTCTRTQVDAMFADKGGGKTGITLNHARIQTREEADGLRAAWSAAFDRLKAKLEAT